MSFLTSMISYVLVLLLFWPALNSLNLLVFFFNKFVEGSQISEVCLLQYLKSNWNNPTTNHFKLKRSQKICLNSV